MVVLAHSLVAPRGANGRSMVISSILKEHVNVFSFMSVFSYGVHVLQLLITGNIYCNYNGCNLWRCHIAPAKPNGPIPFDLNDKRCNLTSQIVFFSICHRAHTYLYRILPGLVPNSPSSYSSSLSFSPCPHRVLTVCIPPPLKYVMLL